MTKLWLRPSFHKDLRALKSGHSLNHKKTCEIIVAVQTDSEISTRLRAESRIPRCVKYELTDGYRAVFQRVDGDDALIALAVGKHDHVDSFLDGHRGWVFDPQTGNMRELRMGTVEESATEIVPSLPRVEPITAPIEGPPLFDSFDEVMLNRLGVPGQFAGDVQNVRDANSVELMTLLEQVAEVSQSAADRLAEYATGNVDTRRMILAIARGEQEFKEQLAAPDLPAVQRSTDEFVAFDDPEELERIIEAGRFEDWQVFLHPSQAALVTRAFEGPARVRGVSGSGKTVVALHRAVALAKRLQPNEAVLLTTFNKALAQAADRLVDTLVDSPEVRAKIQVTHLHRWCLDFLKFRGLGRPRFSPEGQKKCREEALAELQDQPAIAALGEYAWDEIDFICGRFLHEHRDQYLETDRAGRGRSLTKEQRAGVLRLYEAYMAALQRKGLVDPADFVRAALRVLLEGGEPEKVIRHVIVDEVQDFSELGLRLLHALVRDRRDGLLLVGDGTQRIFTRGFSLRGLGIDISGRSLVLRKNYRNTRQILEAAFPLVEAEWEQDLGDGGLMSDGNAPVFSVREGPRPAIVRCARVSDENRFLAREVKYLLSTNRYSPREICVMARNDRIRKIVLQVLGEAGIPAEHYRAEQDGAPQDAVRVSSLHSAKGHEYSAVFIPGLVQGILPMRGAEEDEDGLAGERALLYVGMTRARDILYLSHSLASDAGQPLEPSRFLDRLGPKCDRLQFP